MGFRIGIAAFLDIALPLADALTAAHQKDITHRDLKPANVIVTQATPGFPQFGHGGIRLGVLFIDPRKVE